MVGRDTSSGGSQVAHTGTQGVWTMYYNCREMWGNTHTDSEMWGNTHTDRPL